ncbi:MAG TPA: prepilin-type N-terminal cleavage/methylation domain-containing protein [Planctomycetota bacterium]|nr:prepilin-type N-terminal cleavage/methylation domain-containing protein [Planctomycetota bacterium]
MTERAFTLLELMIAIAIGAVIAGMVIAAARMASDCVTAGNRLAIENQLIGAGVLAACDEIDSWKAYDDPDGGQPLRAMSGPRGLPFTPLAQTWAAAGVAAAWDGGESAWSMHNPRAWWRGCMAERAGSDPVNGFYGVSGASVPIGEPAPTYARYGTPPQPPPVLSGAWQHDMVRGLEPALGMYGLIDYLPANAIYGYYGAPNAWTTEGGVPHWMTVGALPAPQALYPATYNDVFSIVPRNPAAGTGGPADIATTVRARWQTWEGGGSLAANVRDLIDRNEHRDVLMPIAPAHWPRVSARIVRTIHKAYFTNACTVAWTSPLTGATSELRFTGFGTTLRGARQSRGLDGP